MHFRRPAIAHHLHDFLRGRAPHDRIVHQHHALALKLRPIGIVLEAHAQMPDAVRRLDEGAADIVVADDTELERQTRGMGEPQRGRHAGIRHRDHHVGVHGEFARQFLADALARFVDIAPFHGRVRTRH